MPGETPLVAILAAGGATRFGGGKLDAMLSGKRVGQRVLDAVTDVGLDPGIIVTGSEAPRFATDSGWRLVENSAAADGLGTSLALAAREAMAAGSGLLVLLADMPLVDGRHLKELVARGQAATLWPERRAGVPAMIGAELLPQVAASTGDRGAGPLLSAVPDMPLLSYPAEWLIDIDTPADMEAAREALRKRG